MSGSEGSSTKQSTSVCSKGAREEFRNLVTHWTCDKNRCTDSYRKQLVLKALISEKLCKCRYFTS